MKTSLVYLFLLSLFAFPLKAQWTSDSLLNTLVRDSSGTEAATPLSATLSDGSTYVSWFEMYNGQYELRMQLLDPDGNRQWGFEGLTVSSFPQNSALFRYDLAIDHDDNAIVAFQDVRNGGALNVVAYMLNRNGNFLWGPSGILLDDDHAEEGLSPRIGVTDANNIIIAWNADSTGKKWVNYQKISLGGTLAWGSTPMRIIDSTFVAKYSRPSVVPAGPDDFVMLFVRETGSFPYTSTLFAQHFDQNGNGVWPNWTQVSTKTIPFFFFPDAIADSHGGFYVGFNTSNPVNATLNDVYVQHVDAGGATWTATGTEASNLTTNHKTTPALRYIPSRAEIWVLMKVQDSNQSMSGISVQKFDTTGLVGLNPAGVTALPVTTDYYEPFDFTSSGDGLIILLSVGQQIMRADKIDYTGAQAWANGMISVSGVASGKLNAGLGAFANNQVVAVWEDERIDRGVYAQNISADGRLGVLTGIPSASSSFGFNVFPNPSKSLPALNLDRTDNQPVTLQISDVCGHVLFNRAFESEPMNNRVELSQWINGDLQSGIYFVELKSNSYSLVKKWVKE